MLQLHAGVHQRCCRLEPELLHIPPMLASMGFPGEWQSKRVASLRHLLLKRVGYILSLRLSKVCIHF